jgi:hypothetical protein
MPPRNGTLEGVESFCVPLRTFRVGHRWTGRDLEVLADMTSMTAGNQESARQAQRKVPVSFGCGRETRFGQAGRQPGWACRSGDRPPSAEGFDGGPAPLGGSGAWRPGPLGATPRASASGIAAARHFATTGRRRTAPSPAGVPVIPAGASFGLDPKSDRCSSSSLTSAGHSQRTHNLDQEALTHGVNRPSVFNRSNTSRRDGIDALRRSS